MRLLRKLRNFRALAPAERRRTLGAVALVPLVWLGLRALGYARCRRWLTVRPGRAPVAPEPAAAAELAKSYARAVSIAAGNVPCRARCLERSLALWWLLRRRGVAAELRIGVRKPESELEAHAWVELDGLAINDRDDVGERYAAFEECAASGS